MDIGRNIGRLRTYKGIKQATIGRILNMTQQNYSLIENSEFVSEEILSKICETLGVDEDFIRNLPDLSDYTTKAIKIDDENLVMPFNPIDKILELYERLIASEKEKNEILKKNLQ